MENFLQWVGKILEFIKNYGVLNILKAFIIVIIFSFTMEIAVNPKETVAKVMKMVNNINESSHKKSEDVRTAINPIINGILDRAIIDLGCDRAFILEGHNGKNNNNGLAFLYLDMTYERTVNTELSEAVYWEYKDMPTSIFPFFNFLDNARYFYGSVDSLQTIDGKLAKKISINNTNFIAVVEIPGNFSANRSVGILGFSYKEEPTMSQYAIRDYLLGVRGRVKDLLALTSLKGVNLNDYSQEMQCLN